MEQTLLKAEKLQKSGLVWLEWALLKGTARAFPLWTARQSITLKEEIDYEKTSDLEQLRLWFFRGLA